jgi:DNA-directed RNA polymerase II subunit RPB11
MRITPSETLSECKENQTLEFLSRQLLKDPNVRFAGYRKPHPLENYVEIKVQTDGSKTPAECVMDVCDRTINHISSIQNSL